MPLVRMDEKGRIQLPAEVREAWHLKPRQPLLVSVEPRGLFVTRFRKPTSQTDPLLRDIIERPLRLKGKKLTKKLLDKIEREAWMP